MPMRTNRRMLCLIAMVASLMPTIAAAQQQQRPLLDQVDGAIANGTFGDARALGKREIVTFEYLPA